jgi:hypothetical protein
MKVSRTEAHDRLTHLKSQDMDIGTTCQKLVDERPFGNHPFYIFAHKREIGMDEKYHIWIDDMMAPEHLRRFNSVADIPTHRLIWQPRLTKPKAQTNSMLFKAYPGTDVIKVIWMIPDKELWNQYDKGKMLENQTVSESIYLFENDRKRLEAPEDDDLSDFQIDKIYNEISQDARRVKNKVYTPIP